MPVSTYQVVNIYPHDSQAFTQGLIYADDCLYESTGLNGHSSLRKIDLVTGHVLQQKLVPSQYFAEGLTNWGDTLIQLTWKSHVGFVYDRSSFDLLSTFYYDGEGWGLAQDGKHLIISDGSAIIRFIDPSTWCEVRCITVMEHGNAITQLNELELVRGEIYANVWHTDYIVRISPATGQVLGWIDLSGLRPLALQANHDAVLNGIAYDEARNRLFVTGKLWPSIFEITCIGGCIN